MLLHEDPQLLLDLCRITFQAFVLATLASLAATATLFQTLGIAQRVKRVIS